MNHHRIRFVGVLAAALCSLPAVAQFQCGLARDLVMQAIEGLDAGPGRGTVQNGLELIKQAQKACPGSGDVWYYKGLFERELGRLDAPSGAAAVRQQQLVQSALDTAHALKSPAQKDDLSPFQLAAPADKPAPPGPVQQKWALVVGIGQFTGKVDPLVYAAKDARDFTAALKDGKAGRFPEGNVITLLDKDATAANIKAALNSIARQAGPSDLVLVFLASHGTARRADSVGNLSYILAYDTRTSNEDILYGSSLPMAEFSEMVRSRIRAQRTVVLLDMCHSEAANAGGLVREATPSSGALTSMKAGVGRVVIASSGEKQQSYESDTLENGVFTHYLIEGMRQQDGHLPMSAIFAYVAQQVPKTVSAEKQAEQNPVMFRSDQGGDVVLGVAPATAAAAQSSGNAAIVPIATGQAAAR